MQLYIKWIGSATGNTYQAKVLEFTTKRKILSDVMVSVVRVTDILCNRAPYSNYKLYDVEFMGANGLEFYWE